MKIRPALSALLLAVLVSFGALADPLPMTPPESVGLSSQRLQAIGDTLKADIAKGTIPGAILLISRHGKIAYFEAMGSLDPDKKTPMTKDAIFRIYSMTKPITTVAAMMLFEEGKLALGDPVAKYIPAFKDVKVGEEKPGADGKPTLELVASQTADDGAGPDAAQLGPHLRLLRRGRRQEGLPRCQPRRRRSGQRRVRRPPCQAAAGLSAGHDLGLQPVDRRAGPRRRGRHGQAALCRR